MSRRFGRWKKGLVLAAPLILAHPARAQTLGSSPQPTALVAVTAVSLLIVAGVFLHHRHERQKNAKRTAYQLACIKKEIETPPEDAAYAEEFEADIEGRKTHLRAMLLEMDRGLEDLKT